MTVKNAVQRPLEQAPGVQPLTERTSLSTNHWRASDKIRFIDGFPQKRAGWLTVSFDNDDAISGCARSIYSTRFSNAVYSLIGTNEKLYSLFGTELVNITPLVTATTAIADSLDTHYDTLASNPLTTTSGSRNIVIADTEAALFQTGDTYTISGISGAVNGIPDTELNADHIVRAIGSNQITVTVSTAATSSGTGGGASVVRTSGLLTVNATAHGQADGDRTKIAAAASTGGVLDTSINAEHIIRNSQTNSFDIMTGGTATSAVTSGGGSNTTFQVEITDGECDQSSASGYGAGRYGTGLYGTARSSATGVVYPRIWFWDRFGTVAIGTPGEQTGLYEYDGDTSAAPTLVSNAPASINYAFVTNNFIVTLGNTNPNRIHTSDQGDKTVWAGTNTNQVFIDDIEGAGRFTSHVSLRGTNLLFTENQTYTFRYVGLDNGVFATDLLDPRVGLIAPMARIVINGVAYWMGLKNFYMWRGANVEVIPANTQERSTILKYVFDNLNYGQKSKIFVEYIEELNILSFHYPSEGSNEPDREAWVNLNDFSWWPDTIDRTAAEYPNALGNEPLAISSDMTLYRQEVGLNDDTSALGWSLTSSLKTAGKNNANIAALIPDSVQTGNITVNVRTKDYPQSSAYRYNKSYAVSPAKDIVPTPVQGKYWDYVFSGEAVGQNFIMGVWTEELAPTEARSG